MDDWYIQYLKKLGVDVEVKLEDDILEDEEDKEQEIIVTSLLY